MQSRLRIAIAATTIGVLLLVFPADALGSNEKCPVMTDRDASPDITTTYKGQEVRFCCQHCRDEFDANPELYLGRLPQFQELSLRDRVIGGLSTHVRFASAGALLTVLVLLRVARWKRGRSVTTGIRWWNRRLSPTIPLLALVAVMAYEISALRDQVFWTQFEDELHYATFYDFGSPPVPRKPEIPATVTATYYRGNDERNSALFNGGNYRTATFQLSLCDAEARTIHHGEPASGGELFLRFEIDRPPHTPDFLYSDRLMNRMFLTQHFDRFLGRDGAVPDRLGLTAVEPMQHWEARYPLADFTDADGGRSRGLIYVCEEYDCQPHWWSWKEVQGGSRFHYGLQFDLRFEDGKLADTSDIWMGALYRTRKFPQWTVPLSEWFSHRPIPLKPYESTDDEELLGIADYARYERAN